METETQPWFPGTGGRGNDCSGQQGFPLGEGGFIKTFWNEIVLIVQRWRSAKHH